MLNDADIGAQAAKALMRVGELCQARQRLASTSTG